MTVAEKVVYKACPEDPNTTIAVKEAWIESSFYGLRSAIKGFGVERFKQNCIKATDGFNHVLEKLNTQQQNLTRIRQEKIEEFQNMKTQLKTQYREKAESIKEKSSHQWNQAKKAATQATTVHAAEQSTETPSQKIS
jgi:hypothetical protein